MWKSPKKICRNGDFRYISGIFSHILDIAITRLCAKNQAKQMMNSRKNAKKSVFPAYFRHFRPEKYVFRKSGSVTFQTLPFCISVQNYKVQLQKFKKYRFSGGNRLFRRFLESSGYKNQFNLQMNHASLVLQNQVLTLKKILCG